MNQFPLFSSKSADASKRADVLSFSSDSTSWKRLQSVMRSGFTGLSSMQVRVWTAFLGHADNDGISIPTLTTIADIAASGDRTRARTARDELVAMGWLEVVESSSGRKAAVFRVVCPKVKD